MGFDNEIFRNKRNRQNILIYTEDPESDDYVGPGSSSWGNYNAAVYPITSTNAKYAFLGWYGSGWNNAVEWVDIPSPDFLETVDEYDAILLTTGANEERNSKQNICDLAGNCSEWTLEASGYLDDNTGDFRFYSSIGDTNVGCGGCCWYNGRGSRCRSIYWR